LGIDDEIRKSAPGKFIQIPDGFVHYELTGPETARTVVLVHGFSVPYYLWDQTFGALKFAGYRVLRYDLFGRGYSDRPKLVYNGDLFDKQLLDLLNALQIPGKVDLIGASMGGPIVATFACRHPERVRSVSLFDPGYSRGGQPLPYKIRAPIIGEYNFRKLAESLPQSQLADFKHPDRFPEWPNRYKPQMQFKGFRRSILSTLRNYVTTDWSSDYVCIGAKGTPVFLVWGKDDRDVPFDFSKDLLRAIPKAQFLPVEDAAHVPFIEHAEIVNPALLRFLEASN
jgi:pimeloyl-ACP methyl ester carboxylesterase